MSPKLLLLPLVLGTACARHHAVIGKVVDRNGEPMDKVVISMQPGGVEMITDSNGAFMIDYLRDEQGQRTKLSRKTDYSIEVFRTGYNVHSDSFYFKNGELFLDPITLAEDTIRVENSPDNIDPAQFPDRSQSAGAAYEGE